MYFNSVLNIISKKVLKIPIYSFLTSFYFIFALSILKLKKKIHIVFSNVLNVYLKIDYMLPMQVGLYLHNRPASCLQDIMKSVIMTLNVLKKANDLLLIQNWNVPLRGRISDTDFSPIPMLTYGEILRHIYLLYNSID